MARYFQVNNDRAAILYGKAKLDSSQTNLYNGMLVKQASDGELEVVSANTDKPFGVVYEPGLVMAELPTTDDVSDFYAGAYMTVVKGRFLATISHDYFASGSVPATYGTTLHSNGDGYYTTSGTMPALGTIIGFANLQNSSDPDLAETYEVMAIVDFNISQDYII
jgi:hypothetical protein